jgi:hypothetical protein
MPRPLRMEFPGAVYHVAARGNARQDIVTDERDRRRWLVLLERTAKVDSGPPPGRRRKLKTNFDPGARPKTNFDPGARPDPLTPEPDRTL